MTRHFDQRAIGRAAVILQVAERYSGDELDAALKTACRAMEYCLKEVRAGANASRALIEAIDAARARGTRDSIKGRAVETQTGSNHRDHRGDRGDDRPCDFPGLGGG